MGKRNKIRTDNKTAQPSDKLLLVGFLALIILHIIGGFWHSYYSWGFSYWSLFSINTITIFGVLSIIALLATYYYRSKIKLEFLDRFQFTHKSKFVTFIFYTVISIILFFILYNYRSQAHIYGDGYSILEFCSIHSSLVIKDQYYLQLLAVYWHWLMFNMLSSLSFLDKEKIFALTNVIGGIIGLLGIYKITGLLARSMKERIFLLVISLSSASIILFFGYIENYTWAMSFMLWTIYYCIRYIHKSCSIFLLFLFAFISLAFHLITIPVLVTVFYVLLYRIYAVKKILIRLTNFSLFIVICIGSLIILFLSQLKQLTQFVPLWKISGNNYSLFSLNHLSDLFNLILLLAPLGLLFFVFSVLLKEKDEIKNDKTEKVLFVISLLTFLSASFIDPQLGMIRDFDLFSFYGIPLTLWAGYRFSRMYLEDKFPSWIIVASSIIVIIHIVPNLYEKNRPELAVEYLDEVLWKDPHYQTDYQDAYRGLSWGVILEHNVNRGDLSEKYFTKRSTVDQFDPTPFYNLGSLYNKKNQLDSSRYYFQKGFELNPQDPKFLSKLAEVECKLQNFQLAEKLAKESLAIDSNHLQGLIALGNIYGVQNQMGKSIVYLRKAYDLNPNAYIIMLNLGAQYAKGINADSALYYYDKSLSTIPNTLKIKILSRLISITLYQNHQSKAIEYLNQLKQIAPNSALVRKKEKEIYGQ